MMDIYYTWEKLYTAVHSLATGPGTLQERLEGAFIPSLSVLDPVDFPDSLQEEFRNLQRELNSAQPVGDEATAIATISKLSETEAMRYSERILSFYDRITRYHEPIDE